MKRTAKWNSRFRLALGSKMKTKTGGANRDRTGDLLLAKQALSQLSYGPFGLFLKVVLASILSVGLWWVWMDSNHRPPPYQDGALTN